MLTFTLISLLNNSIQWKSGLVKDNQWRLPAAQWSGRLKLYLFDNVEVHGKVAIGGW